MTQTETIVAIVLGFIASGGFWGFIQFIIEKLPKRKKKATLEDVMARLDKMQAELDDNTKISVATARDRLNYLSNTYMDLGYIPKKDYVAFKMLGEEYCKKHNSEVQIRFKWCMENLDPK